MESLLNGVRDSWFPRHDRCLAQVDTYSELGMMGVLTPFWELARVCAMPLGTTARGSWEERTVVPDGQDREVPL